MRPLTALVAILIFAIPCVAAFKIGIVTSVTKDTFTIKTNMIVVTVKEGKRIKTEKETMMTFHVIGAR